MFKFLNLWLGYFPTIADKPRWRFLGGSPILNNFTFRNWKRKYLFRLSWIRVMGQTQLQNNPSLNIAPVNRVPDATFRLSHLEQINQSWTVITQAD